MSAVVLEFKAPTKDRKARFRERRQKMGLAAPGETAGSVDDLVMMRPDADTAPSEMNCWDDGA